jgi:[protein-PII] uridylyltransferase
VTGDQGLFEALDARVRHPDAAWRAALVDGLRRLTSGRHAAHNDTIYQLEPDLKLAPGGLRDLAAARVLTALSDESTAAMIEEDRLDQAENFLLRVRSVLHLEAGRNMNVLTHQLQERAAERLRIPGAVPEQRVEALMGRYFGHARVVARTLSRAWRVASPSPARPTIVVNAELRLTASGVDFSDHDRASADPASWFGLFEVALERGEPVADEALAVIERRVGRYALADLLPAPADLERLFAWLRPARGLYARLTELHDCGLLGRLFPGFAAITSRVIRDFYHKYTVDEHTLLAIRNIERLLDPAPGRERFAALLGEVLAPERLVLALLLHDVGKWKEEDHAAESARMATSMLRQLGASDEARDDILFLVAQHLAMSARAFRRDGDDPGVARELAVLAGTEDRLKMLCLLTLADVEAVGPGTLTPWKEELLWRLYVDAYNELTIAYADRVIDGAQAAVAALQADRPVGLSDADLSRFLEGLPQRYLAVVDRQHVYAHARLARDVHRDEVRLLLERRGGAWELAVVTLDKPQLFSNICGVLSYLGMDILRGSVMTSTTGLVLDIFQFVDREGFLERNAAGPTELDALLRDVVAGRRDVVPLVERKARGPLHRRKGPSRVRPVVYFDTDHSEHYTVLEIVADDALGLLHRVSRIISEHGCSVELVLIATEGRRAIDVFHLTGPEGKLPALARGALKADLERMLEETDDED